MPNWCSKGR